MRRALVLVPIVLAAGLPVRAQPLGALVEVRNNFYNPQEIHIAPGDTVTWEAKDNGHTVTSDDLRFDFFPNRRLDRGERVSYAFLTDETVRYHCRVHGERGGIGMSGVIVVGAGSPTPTPPPPPPREERTVPSPGFPTIASALNGLPPGSLVSVLPGVYRESVILSVPGLTLRGAGGVPSEVVLDGGGATQTGVTVAADGVRVENLTLRRFAQTGLQLQSAARFEAARVEAEDNGEYGIVVSGSRRGAVRDVRATRSGKAGVLVRGCRDCDVLLERVVAEDNLFGVAVSNAGGVVLRGSTMRGNGTGIVLRSAPALDAPQQGAHVRGNTIEGNVRGLGIGPAAPETDFPVGAGVWIAGGTQDVVEANAISGHEYGVLVTGPSVDDRVVSNVVSGSRLADLAWDGVGAAVCFAGNRSPEGAEPTSDPPAAQELYSCELPVTVGVPNPRVAAHVALYAVGLRP